MKNSNQQFVRVGQWFSVTKDRITRAEAVGFRQLGIGV